MRVIATHVIAASLIFLGFSLAAAQDAPEWAVCNDLSAAPELRIEKCTILTVSQQESLQRRAFAYFRRGNAWSDTLNFARAVADYDDAIRLVPNNALYFSTRANALHLDGQPDRALADFTEALRLEPENVTARRGRGLIFLDKGEFDSALGEMSEAIRLAPDIAMSHYARSMVYQQKGDFDRALVDIDEALRLQPDDQAALDGRCSVRGSLGPLSEAAAAVAECSDRLAKRASVSAFDGRAMLFLRLGRFDEAIADFSSALALEPHEAHSLYGRGVARIRKGDRAGGEKDIAAAKESLPGIADHFRKYGPAGAAEP